MLSFCLGEARTSRRLPAASTVIIWKIRSPINGANRPVRFQKSHVPAVHILLFFSGKCSGRLCTSAPRTAVFRSVKNSFCPTIPLPRFPPLKAFFSSLHTAVFPSALVQLTIEKANPFPCSSST